MHCYVNCNLRVVTRRPEVLQRHLDDRIAPELGLDPILLDAASPDWHTTLAARLDALDLPRGVHLPFFDLQPGSFDREIREATCKRLTNAMAVAKRYRPDHMVGHAAYNRFLYRRSVAEWADRAAETWAKALASWPDHPPLYLENTHETEPAWLLEAVYALKNRLPADQADRIGVCFDIGHWHSLAAGHSRNDLDNWIATLAPCLRHLHLHDNDGSFDQHLGPGKGSIPFATLFDLLQHNNLQPSTTFEPHTDFAYAQCLAFAADQSTLAMHW